jgi:hypothetical protein
MATAIVETPAGLVGLLRPNAVVALGRRTIDSVLISIDVHKELASQNINFPAKYALTTGGRADLAKWGGQKVDTGKEAQAYASYINGLPSSPSPI